jgi:hypothetical protein
MQQGRMNLIALQIFLQVRAGHSSAVQAYGALSD